MDKKALVVVTYNREDSLKKVLESINILLFDHIVVVKDGGSPYSDETTDTLNKLFTFISFEENKGVGICKQTGIDYILNETSCDHIFILEDDVLVTDNSVWDYYIDFSRKSGVWHTNWNDYRYKNIQFEVDYDGVKGIITRDTEGSFSYFHRNIFKFCKFPSNMKNAFEHISLELQLIENDLLPPFWSFICPKDSHKFLMSMDVDSTITGQPNYTENYQNSMKAFEMLHGVTINKIQQSSSTKVLERLKFLKETYGK